MSQNKTSHAGAINKKTVAVFFGGRSPEHDVSVISALQALQALDQALYNPLPVYIAPNGAWYVGDLLKKRENYLLSEERIKHLTEVTLDVSGARGGVLIPKKQPLFGAAKPIPFHVAIPAFHGLYGEDGNMQGVFELANIPYTGMRTKASALLMDKVTTKYFLNAIDVPALPFAVLKRPDQGYLIAEDILEEKLKSVGFPCIIKPSHLGSSIGVAKVDNVEQAKASLPAIFEFDDVAIAEPFVENLVEYNVSIARIAGKVETSAIERPKASDELLDFKQKYMSGGDDKGGSKMSGNKTFSTASEGMLSLTREINPDLPAKTEQNIRDWSARMFEAIDGTGAARIDFIGNSETGEIWMNEVNPCPGSFAYFLWEAASNPLLFTDLLSALIAEAMSENASRSLPYDPVPPDARLLKRNI
ncbi:MAG: D-alanine--D-alanine ligase [Alphaproteobacteria bacterium]